MFSVLPSNPARYSAVSIMAIIVSDLTCVWSQFCKIHGQPSGRSGQESGQVYSGGGDSVIIKQQVGRPDQT